MGLYTVTYKGIDLLGRLLAGQDVAINGVYMEFINSAGPAPSVTPDPADGREYYADLETTLDQSYLRIPLSNVPILSSTDEAKFETNKATFFAMSTGFTVGQGNGLSFSAASLSKVYGLALVYMPDIGDRSQDVVFSRSYNFTAVSKEIGQEISMSMAHVFGESMISSS